MTHEPPLRMAERSPAAKQSIYAFKMAAKNATHPTPRLPLPRPTYISPCRPLSAAVLTPVELSTSLSRMPPKLFNFGTQPLTANQPILPSLSVRVFRSLLTSLSISVSSPFYLSRFLSTFFISLDSRFLFPWDIFSFASGEPIPALRNDAPADR